QQRRAAAVHRGRRAQGARADRGGGQSRAEAARVHLRRRLLGLPVRLHLRRGPGRGRLRAGARGRDPAVRSAVAAIPHRRRDRLQREPGRCAVRDTQSEREDHLRLRLLVLRLNMGAATQGNTFAGLSLILDRMAERRDDTAWVAAQAIAPDVRFLLLDAAGRAFLHADRDALRWLDAVERRQLCADTPAWLLGIADGHPHFLLALADDAHAGALEASLVARRASLREAGLLLPADEAGLFAYAKGLAHWQRETRHCAHCGAPLVIVSAGRRMHFPRTDAAIIVIVEHEGACLLGRQASWPPGRYSTLAGFIEPGEALEDAVRREVMEESGVLVGEVHYHSSQPWPMPSSLMVGFTAVA